MTSKEQKPCRVELSPQKGEDPTFHSHGASPSPGKVPMVPVVSQGHSYSLNTVSHCCPPWQAQICLQCLDSHVPSLVSLYGRGEGMVEEREESPIVPQPSWDVWTQADGQCQRENTPLSRPRNWLMIKIGLLPCPPLLPPPSTPGLSQSLSPILSLRASVSHRHMGRCRRTLVQTYTRVHTLTTQS